MRLKDLPKNEYALSNRIMGALLEYILEMSVDEAIKQLDFSKLDEMKITCPMVVERAIELGIVKQS